MISVFEFGVSFFVHGTRIDTSLPNIVPEPAKFRVEAADAACT